MMIGVFISQLTDAYQGSIWQGIVSRIRETGNGAIGFIGQRLKSIEGNESSHNIAYHLANRENVDGIIILSSAMGTFQGTEGIAELVRGKNVPVVSVGLNLEGIPAVLANMRSAMSQMVGHLLSVHGRSKFALIAGPLHHQEADEREEVFRNELASAGVTFNERLLARGNFMEDSGAAATVQLLATGLPFDALVCLNDRMATGAMSVLRDAGYKIPLDIAVTGFDDINEARWESPPLTTINQPLFDMGQKAVDMMLDIANHRHHPNEILPCEVVWRQSCGCQPPWYFGIRPHAKFRTPTVGPPAQSAVSEQLNDALAHNNPDDFLIHLNEILITESSDPSAWHELLIQMASHWTMDHWVFDEAHSLVSSAEIRYQAATRIQLEKRHQMIWQFSSRLAGSFGMESMIGCLSEGLQRLQVRQAFLAMFQDQGDAQNGVPAQSRLLMFHSDAKPILTSLQIKDGSNYPTLKLVPPNISPDFASKIWIFEPLVYFEETMGFLILDGENSDPTLYENLREQVASTLKGTLLLERILGHEQELEHEVSRRTKELKLANRKLIEGMEQRRTLEHDVQVISDRTMQVIGQDLHDDLCQFLAGISMFAALLETDLHQQTSVLVNAATKVRQMLEESIIRTRQIARGLYPPGLEERGLIAVLEDLVDSLTYAGKVRISLQVDAEFSWLDAAHSLQIFRIIQESIGNSIRHSGSELIIIHLYSDSGQAVVEVRDFGCGMPSLTGENPAGHSGMGLRIMRYRAESIGAELTIHQMEPGVCISCRMTIPTGSIGENHG